MFSRILFLGVCALCLSVCCDGSALKPFNYMNDYEWSTSQETNSNTGTSYSETRKISENDQGSKEVITKTVVRTGADGKPIANTTIITIQRDGDGKIIDKKVQTTVGPANENQQQVVSTGSIGPETESNVNSKVGGCMRDDECPADKFCSNEMKCEDQLPLNEECTRDRECGNGGRCIEFKCRAVRRDGKTGSYCDRDGDCSAGHCCQRYENAGKCAYLKRQGEDCGSEDFFGGIGWFTSSLPTRCPCETGLFCEEEKDSWSLGKTCLPKSEKKSRTVHAGKSKTAVHKKRKH